ncbi:hypothetical protein BXZ70DRAFT_1042373 [Cristinia sonorae]|uniref:Uncharacterized protein n=1 Tax=Cristinia sonorae TaxID=1940300 RepID=A0A8K0XLJ8_9AGAR|nr:hypothetical protein BXZ70DRAFT_1042373 [Cristinia sonorae]
MHVPQELVDIVIDNLHDDKHALKTCSLVAPHWLHSSRLHLWHDLDVAVSEQPRSFHAFDEFLKTAPVIGSYVRNVRFQHGRTVVLEPFAFFTAGPRPQSRIAADHLASILAKLPRLKSLLLDTVSIGGSDTHRLQTSLRPYQLHSVTLTNVRIEQSDYAGKYLFDIFTLFSRVKHLRLRNLSTSFFPDPFRPFRLDAIGPSVDPHRLHVESLALDMSITTREYADVIHRSLDCNQLSSLSATCMQIDELPLVGRIIHDAAATLTHFEFNLRNSIVDDMPTRSDWRELHLSTCTALTSLVLHFTLEGYPGSAPISQAIWTQVVDLLNTLPSASPLASLSFNIVFLGDSEDEQLGSLDWGGFREALRRFYKLTSMEFWSYDSRLGVGGSHVDGYGTWRVRHGQGTVMGSVGDDRRNRIENELQEWKKTGVLCIC